MAFALYGDTSGGERDARDMRSQHAAPDLLTEVEFDFALGERALPHPAAPATGAPAQARRRHGHAPRRRPPSGARSSGDERPGAAKPLADGWTDVTRAAEDILGFRGEQFRQVVMLPQGRFQELLQAKSQDKEKILATLFDTAFYARVEIALKRARRHPLREHERLAIERETILEQVGATDADDLATQRTASAVDARRCGGRASRAQRRAGGGAEGAERGRRPSPPASPTSSAQARRRAAEPRRTRRRTRAASRRAGARPAAAPLAVDDGAVGDGPATTPRHAAPISRRPARPCRPAPGRARRHTMPASRPSTLRPAREARRRTSPSPPGARAAGRQTRRRSPTTPCGGRRRRHRHGGARERRGSGAPTTRAAEAAATPPRCPHGRGWSGGTRRRSPFRAPHRHGSATIRRRPDTAMRPPGPTSGRQRPVRRRRHTVPQRLSITSASLRPSGTRDRRPGLPQGAGGRLDLPGLRSRDHPAPARAAETPHPDQDELAAARAFSTRCSSSATRRPRRRDGPAPCASRPLAERASSRRRSARRPASRSRASASAVLSRGRRERRDGGGRAALPRSRSGRRDAPRARPSRREAPPRRPARRGRDRRHGDEPTPTALDSSAHRAPGAGAAPSSPT